MIQGVSILSDEIARCSACWDSSLKVSMVSESKPCVLLITTSFLRKEQQVKHISLLNVCSSFSIWNKAKATKKKFISNSDFHTLLQRLKCISISRSMFSFDGALGRAHASNRCKGWHAHDLGVCHKSNKEKVCTLYTNVHNDISKAVSPWSRKSWCCFFLQTQQDWKKNGKYSKWQINTIHYLYYSLGVGVGIIYTLLRCGVENVLKWKRMISMRMCQVGSL